MLAILLAQFFTGLRDYIMAPAWSVLAKAGAGVANQDSDAAAAEPQPSTPPKSRGGWFSRVTAPVKGAVGSPGSFRIRKRTNDKHNKRGLSEESAPRAGSSKQLASGPDDPDDDSSFAIRRRQKKLLVAKSLRTLDEDKRRGHKSKELTETLLLSTMKSFLGYVLFLFIFVVVAFSTRSSSDYCKRERRTPLHRRALEPPHCRCHCHGRRTTAKASVWRMLTRHGACG